MVQYTQDEIHNSNEVQIIKENYFEKIIKENDEIQKSHEVNEILQKKNIDIHGTIFNSTFACDK